MEWPPKGSFEVALPQRELLYRDDPEKKYQFGIALRTMKAVEAAMSVFSDTTQALWVSQNWLNDPIVLSAVKTEEKDLKLLDKEQLAAKFLAISEEKDQTGKFYIYEAKDRIAALKVYAEICGYIGKIDIDASTKNFVNKTVNIKLVSPEKKVEKVIEAIVIEASVIDNNVLPMRVKLVS